MIEKPTVFVLGAGASNPYGFPTGVEFTNPIFSWTHSSPQNEELNRISNVALGQAKRMAECLRTAQISIDLWLTQNMEWLPVGKYCIAKIIAATETAAQNLSGDWYARLWRSLLPPLPANIKDLLKNQVTFVTFNYDRSLEQALMMKTRATFAGASEETCAEVLNELRIIHVHGQLGRLPWQQAKGYLTNVRVRPYQPQYDPEELFLTSGAIKVVAEARRDSPEFTNAQERLRTAESIHFLGFGFNDENLQKLGFVAGAIPPPARGTHKGLSARRKEVLQSPGGKLGIPISFEGLPEDVDKYFKEIFED